MSRRQILSTDKVQTQTVEAVKSLLAWRGRAAKPLPEFVELSSNGSRCVLVLSNKKDCFYVVTARDCSCPAATYQRGPCKHRRQHFPEQPITTAAKPAAVEQPNAGRWHGHNGPVLDEIESSSSSSSIPLVDTLGEPSAGELAYWSIQEDKALWPAEA